MTVATYAQSNFTVDDPTTYRGKLDGNCSVGIAIVDNFAPHQLTTAVMMVQLDVGAVPSVGVIPTKQAQQTSALLVAPVANPRNDIMYIDAISGLLGVATGTEAVTPVDPAIPAGKIPIARLAMTVGMLTITNSIITDLRAPALVASGMTVTNQANTDQVLTDAASIVWNCALGGIATVTLAGNRAMTTPTSLVKGTYILVVIQDATGSRTLTWSSNFKWSSGVAPSLSTAAGAKDIISFFCDGTNLYGSLGVRGAA